MKTTLLIVGLFILAGCSLSSPYVDAEYGVATRAVQDQQVAFPEAPYAQQIPEGLGGITAEEVMNSHNQSYAKQEQGAGSMSFGLIGSSSGGE